MSVFLSHSSQDKTLVQDLHKALENLGVTAWMDSRELTAGDALTPNIQEKIAQSEFVLVVFSPHSINSAWVLDEIDWAKEHGKKLIPLCLPGVQHTLVKRLVGSDLLIIQHDPTQPLCLIMPSLLAALGQRAPDNAQAVIEQEPTLSELVLKLRNPQAVQLENIRRFSAEAELIYYPADKHSRETTSKRFTFTAPLGPIENAELAWYLEHYFVWPVGVFKERGEAVEKQLPAWGKLLYQAALSTESARNTARAWQQDSAKEKRFSIEVDADALDGAPEAEIAASQEAGTELLALPWELLHNGTGWLFQGACPAQVRRRLPNHEAQPAPLLSLPIRVLLASPRPEQDGVGYIDHRVSAAPLAEALGEMGCLAELTVLSPPTFPAMQEALRQAHKVGKPFQVVHFDGHGVYDARRGLGALCFEDPADSGELRNRRMALVYADQLAAELQSYRIPLVFLDACQSAQSETRIEASVAGSLLQQGVTSVVAMSHSVLVETARRFVGAFYRALARGERVGAAMLAGQRTLHGDPVRGRIPGAGELRMQDWFVPVLYQEQQDPRLFRQLLPQAAQRLETQRRRLSLGALPEPPPHQFAGRSRELLALERLLSNAPYAVLRGQGGAGKTTLACELARWLVRTGRFERAAFVSLEETQHERAVLDAIGQQVLPEGKNWSVAEQDVQQGLQQVVRALNEHNTLIVLDNCESVLPRPEKINTSGTKDTKDTEDTKDTKGTNALETLVPFVSLVPLVLNFLENAPHTRLLFTSRERLPEPFAAHTVELGPLSRTDALQLLAQVLEQRGIPLPAPDSKQREQAERDLTDLVDSLHCHARALVLLAPELAQRGIHAVTDAAREILAALDKKHPGDRENSLYASIELSLRRLPDELRVLVPGLAVLHGGGHLFVIGQVLGVDEDTARRLAIALIAVGLAEDAGYGHLRLDPALPLYCALALRERAGVRVSGQKEPSPPTPLPEGEGLTERHAAAMEDLLGFLYQQRFQDAKLAHNLALLELPNLLALLRRRTGELQAGEYAPAQAIELGGKLEQLLAPLGRPVALAETVALREQAADRLKQQGGAWTHAHYLHAASQIDHLLQQGALPQAYQTAQDLLQSCLNAQQMPSLGEMASVLAYDTAIAYFKLGRVLNTGGAAQAALEPLAEAQGRFEALAQAGNQDAVRMASACLAESGDCLRDLGRLDAAARAYEERIARGGKQDDQRGVAVGKGQLGTVRMLQQNYPAALAAYREAREQFTALGEPGSVATAWHQTGRVYREMRQWDEAEQAYREATRIFVQTGNKAHEATNLLELGNLYSDMGRPEEAVNFFCQAAEIYTQLGDKANEGRARSNAAIDLIKLHRHDEARRELRRAIECDEAYGHAAQPWKTWAILCDLEQAEGNVPAATAARARAVGAYLAYRRDGGEPQAMGGKLCEAVTAALRDNTASSGVIPQLAELAQHPDLPGELKAVIPKLHAILEGSRDPALADDPALHYSNAAELLLLLEQL